MIRLPGYLTLLCVVAAIALTVSGTAQVAAPGVGLKSKHKAAPLSKHERAIHALDRFTFGPRPGDVERVEAQGVDKWLDRQLHPQRIDDSGFELRLNKLPAMHLSSADLLRKYPPVPVLRLVEAGRLAIPADPVEHAIYLDALDKFRAQREQKQAKPQPATQESNAMTGASPAPQGPQAGNDLVGAGMPAPGTVVTTPHAGGPEGKRLLAMPPAERWSALLAEEPGAVGSIVRNMKRPDRQALIAGLTPVEKESLIAMVDINRVVAGELMEEKVLRTIYSDRQFGEVMTDFWLNHFNIYLRKNGEMPWLLATYERDVIRPLALGNFEQLLEAVAHSPAMLVYLDNQQSIGPNSIAASNAARKKGNGNLPGLNENYARELMELHTLGVNGGYTQKDVTEVAKVFTGWGVESLRDGSGFRFENRRHEPGTKTVLGRRISEGGEKEGVEVLHMLAQSSATARFISTELAMRFVSDNPPPALIDRMSRRFMKTHGDIGQVLREMVKSRDFWSRDAYHAKVKTPLEFIASATRATNAEVENAGSLVQALDRLGMPLYGVQQPNGYSLKADPWLGSQGLLMRFNFAVGLTANRLEGIKVSLSPDLDGADRGQETSLEQRLLNRPAEPETQAAILMQKDLAPLPGDAKAMMASGDRGGKIPQGIDPSAARATIKTQTEDDKNATTAALLLGSPEFQRH